MPVEPRGSGGGGRDAYSGTVQLDQVSLLLARGMAQVSLYLWAEKGRRAAMLRSCLVDDLIDHRYCAAAAGAPPR